MVLPLSEARSEVSGGPLWTVTMTSPSSTSSVPSSRGTPSPRGLVSRTGERPDADSTTVPWHRRAGLFLAVRYLRSHATPVVMTPLEELPHLSKRAIRLALRIFPDFLDRADLTFPIIIAGRGWYQIALDGRHRISKAIWTGRGELPTVRVPFHFAFEILCPGVYEAEWLILFFRDELRKTTHRPHVPRT